MSKKIIFILLLIFVIPTSIKADCSNKELNRFKSLASHINLYYDYDEVNNTFNINVYNIKNELYIINKNNNEQYINQNQELNDINIYGVTPGTRLTLAVYPIGGECQYYRVKTMYVNLPTYNQYYNDPICNNNSNQLCSKWANTSIYTYEQFIEKVKASKEENKTQNPTVEEEEKKYSFFDFLEDYYIYILLLIIVLGSYGIYKLDKKNKFDF